VKINNTAQLHDFINTVKSCKHSVWLESVNGEYYDLKDEFDFYRGVGALLKDKSEALELFASDRADEAALMSFIRKNAA